MSVRVNLCRNPKAGTNTTDWITTASAGTPTLTRVTASSGGPVGVGNSWARSTLAASATNVDIRNGGVGVNVVTAGTTYTSSASIRPTSAAATTASLYVVWYDASSAYISESASVTLGALTSGWTRYSITGTAPALAVRAQLVFRAATTGSLSSGDTLDVTGILFEASAVLDTYFDGDTSLMSFWSGTANASTSTLYTPVLTATPYTDAAPAPRVVVTVDDLPPAITTLTMFRLADGRTFKVRGAINVPVAGGFALPDVEAPFQVASAYRVQMFAAGIDQGYSVTVSATLAVTDCWVHNTLDPTGAVMIDVTDASGKSLNRPIDGEVFYPEGRSLGVLISGRRRGLQGVDMFFSTLDTTVATKFEAMLGGYEDTDQMIPILCVRTPPYIDIPRTFYAGMLSPRRLPINVHMGGTLRNWAATADELAPPAPGLVVALLSRDDIDFFYATRNAVDAAYSSRLALDRDYTKAGLV